MKVFMCTGILALGVAVSVTPSANADLLVFETVFMDGLQEVPPNATPGYGTATVTFDTDTNLLTVNGEFTDLIGQYTASHVHGLAPAGQNAGVIFGLNLIGGGGNAGTI